MNTGCMIEAFKAGAESMGQEVEVKRIRLYEIDFKDCYACMACKMKDSKFRDVCGRKDDWHWAELYETRALLQEQRGETGLAAESYKSAMTALKSRFSDGHPRLLQLTDKLSILRGF